MAKTQAALAALVLFLGSFPALHAQGLSSEEIIVRNTYAKLAYAVQIGTVHALRTTYKMNGAVPATTTEIRDAVEKEGLKFTISNFNMHAITDASVKYADLVTKPNGQSVLMVTQETLEVAEKGKSIKSEAAQAGWTKGQDLQGEDWNIPASQAFAQMPEAAQYSKYAAFTVTVAFQGKSRTYHAIFLFGTANGEPKYLPIDTVTNDAALLNVVTKSVYPTIFTETSLSKDRVVADWLKSNASSEPICKPGQHQVCCDPETMGCKIPTKDVPISAFRESGAKLEEAGLHTPVPILAQIQTCSGFNYTGRTTYYVSPAGTQEHVTGDHQMSAAAHPTCMYYGGTRVSPGPPWTIQCGTEASTQAFAGMAESGIVYSPSIGFAGCHKVAEKGGAGNAINPDGAAAVSVEALGAAVDCAFCLCGVSIGISPFSVSPTPVWEQPWTYSYTCPSRTYVTITPIILDLGGGYHLTSKQDGVTLDWFGNGKPVKMSWTAANSNDAILVMFRSEEAQRTGKVSGYDLFGNLTAQFTSDHPNGWNALKYLAETSGDHRGIIDSSDPFWPKLWAWIDTNHDGIAQRNELHSLESVGICNIGLSYNLSLLTDEFGNQFKYKGGVNVGCDPKGDRIDKTAYDVDFVVDQNAGPLLGNRL